MKKESPSESRAITEEVKHSLSINSTLDQVAAVMSGKQSSINVPSKKEIKSASSGVVEPENHYINFDGLAGKIGVTGSATNANAPKDQTSSVYNKISNELGGICLDNASDSELAEIALAIKEKVKEIVAQRVIYNTKNMSKGATKFFNSKNGMRMEFSLLGQKVSMRANGEFSGNEFFHLVAEGDSPVGRVMKIDHNGSFINVSNNFDISIG